MDLELDRSENQLKAFEVVDLDLESIAGQKILSTNRAEVKK